MSSTLRVELPAYSHSFQVQVSPASTIHDVKNEIAKVCPGSPRPEGQRLVWRGRFLRDEEKVEDVWKSPDDSLVIHLAVHPSAWSSTPPPLPSAGTHPIPSSTLRPTPTHLRTSAGQYAPTPTWQSPLSQLANPYALLMPIPAIAYTQYLHNMALAILSAGAITMPPSPTMNEIEVWRSAAKDLYRTKGWIWPGIFDDPLPSGTLERGAVYEPVTLEGLPYLQLAVPGALPTPAQLHALQILSHTFSILSMATDPAFYTPSNPYPVHTYSHPTNLNHRLQQLGLPTIRLAGNQAANLNANDPNNHNPLVAPGAPGAEIRAIPVRALIIPLIMLAFRTLLLLYFFSPSKRPLFGIVLSAWILYEAWNALRMVLNDGGRRVDAAVNQGAANGAAVPGQRAAQAAGAGQNGNGRNANSAAGRSSTNAILDRLSTINLTVEDAILDTDAAATGPGVAQKTKMFFALFFMTLWPSAWDRRRNALRRREGRIRTEASAREAALSEHQSDVGGQQEGERSGEDEARVRAREQLVARHERRPAWLREYVHRVQYTEWVDDP